MYTNCDPKHLEHRQLTRHVLKLQEGTLQRRRNNRDFPALLRRVGQTFQGHLHRFKEAPLTLVALLLDRVELSESHVRELLVLSADKGSKLLQVRLLEFL